MQRICIYQNPDGSWIFQNLSKRKAKSCSSLNSLINDVFRNWFEFIADRFTDETYAPYKKSQLLGYIKNIVKQFSICYIDFPGNLETGIIDETIKISGTATDFIFKLN